MWETRKSFRSTNNSTIHGKCSHFLILKQAQYSSSWVSPGKGVWMPIIHPSSLFFTLKAPYLYVAIFSSFPECQVSNPQILIRIYLASFITYAWLIGRLYDNFWNQVPLPYHVMSLTPSCLYPPTAPFHSETHLPLRQQWVSLSRFQSETKLSEACHWMHDPSPLVFLPAPQLPFSKELVFSWF